MKTTAGSEHFALSGERDRLGRRRWRLADDKRFSLNNYLGCYNS
jgi:hypothetical protein